MGDGFFHCVSKHPLFWYLFLLCLLFPTLHAQLPRAFRTRTVNPQARLHNGGAAAIQRRLAGVDAKSFATQKNSNGLLSGGSGVPTFQQQFLRQRQQAADENELKQELIAMIRKNRAVAESWDKKKNIHTRDIVIRLPGEPPVGTTVGQAEQRPSVVFPNPRNKQLPAQQPQNAYFSNPVYHPGATAEELEHLLFDRDRSERSMFVHPHHDVSESAMTELTAAAEPAQSMLTGVSGLLIPVNTTSFKQEVLRWPADIPLAAILPQSTPTSRPFLRYRAPQDRFIRTIRNQIVYDNWWAEWSRSPTARATWALVANNFGFLSLGLGLRDGITDFATGWSDVVINAYTNNANSEVSLGIAKGRYGVFADISRRSHAAAAEVIGRFFEVATLADFGDRDYGFRIRVRNLDISVRHDFDEFYNPAGDTFATQFLVAYGPLGVVGGIDIPDTRYALGLGYRGTSVTVQRDFDERKTSMVAEFGRAWELSLDTDFVDQQSDEVFARIGFGRLAHAFFSIGAGISEEGIPEAYAGLQLPDTLVEFQLFQTAPPNYLLQYAITVRKMTYVWRTEIVPRNLRVPNFLGFMPQQVHDFLARRQP